MASIKSLKARKFISLLSDRQKTFDAAKASLTEIPDNATALARALHPKKQYVTVSKVIERADDCKSFVLVPDKNRGTEKLAFFGAGKYLTVFEEINGMKITRAYSISSSPRDTLNGFYMLTIKRVDGGLMSNYILDTWKEGTEVTLSAPEGNFEYQPLRDAKNVICLAGGSGITPFVSMAGAILDGDEDFNLTLLYGSRNKDNILFYDELKEIANKTDKVKVINVLSDKDADVSGEGFESGFITAELIKKYAPENEAYSVFICGPQAMYQFLDTELQKLELPKKYVRHEMFGECHNPKAMAGYPSDIPETVSITVTIQDKTTTVTGSTDDTVLQILEKNGISAPARCRSGECGFCHSHLISGKVYVPENMEFRRLADFKFGCIHPCCSFPLTDLVINVPVSK